MVSMKAWGCVLVASLCLLLVMPGRASAQDPLHEDLPVGAITRMGRGTVQVVRFSPDGTHLAVGGSLGIWLYDTATWEAEALLAGPADYIYSLAFSPDGRFLASTILDVEILGPGIGNFDQHFAIRVWDLTDGTFKELDSDRDVSLSDMAYSPDGRTLASGGADGIVRLWDVETGTVRFLEEGRHQDYITRLAFSADGRTLAGVGADSTIRLWDVASGSLQGILDIVALRESWFPRSVLPDYRRAVTHGGPGFELRAPSTATSTLKSELMFTHGSETEWGMSIGILESFPEARTLATINFFSDSIYLWDVETETLLHELDAHARGVTTASFSPDGRTLASGGGDGTVRLWDVETGILRHALEDHTDDITRLAFSADGRTLTSFGREDGTVRLWDVPGGMLRELMLSLPHLIRPVFSTNGRMVASGHGDALRLWDVVTGTLLHELDTDARDSLALSPNGRTLASIDRGHRIRLWDVVTGTLLHELESHTAHVHDLTFSPDGRTLASGGVDKIIHLWEVGTGALLHELEGHTGVVLDLAFNPDGRVLASADNDHGIRLWDPAAGTLEHTLESPTSGILHPVFSPDGRTLAGSGRTANLDGGYLAIGLWDVETGTFLHNLTGHRPGITNDAAFSPDGRFLAGSGNDGIAQSWEIHLWETETGTLRHSFAGHGDYVTSVAFSPDGRTLASGSADGTILLWDVRADAAAGTFGNLETNPDGRWEVWRIGSTVTIQIHSPRAPVQYHARQSPEPLFVLPAGFRPVAEVRHTVAGTQVDADRTPLPHAPPAAFDLTIGSNGEVRIVDNPQVDGLGYVDLSLDLRWQTDEAWATTTSEAAEPTAAPGG